MESLRRLTPAAYAVAVVFLLSPVVDVVANVSPMEPGSIQWRFGAVGIMSNYLISAIFGLLLGTLLAAATGRRTMLWVFATLNIVTALVLLATALLFGLDVLQLKNVVRPEAAAMFKIGSAKAAFKIVTAAIALLMLGIGGFRTARGKLAASGRKGGRSDAPLIVRAG